MESSETQPTKSQEVIRSREYKNLAEMSFDTAVKYLAAIAQKHEGSETILVALYGTPNSGKAHFLKKVEEILTQTDESGKKHTFSMDGSSPEEVETFEQLKNEYPGMEFPMLILHSTDQGVSTVDLTSAKIFKRFPELVLYIYNPKLAKPDPGRIFESIVQDRKGYAEINEIRVSMPEIILVKNPEAKNK